MAEKTGYAREADLSPKSFGSAEGWHEASGRRKHLRIKHDDMLSLPAL